MRPWGRYWRIARVWRAVILSLLLIDLGLGGAYWALTGDLYGSMRLSISPLLVITGTAVVTHYFFSINIFGRMQKPLSPSGRLFVFMCALGLYLSVVAAILFATSFLLLWVMQTPRTTVLAIVGAELALFSVIGYMGFTRLRRNMRWLSETRANVVGD